jgi:hypothetical protein
MDRAEAAAVADGAIRRLRALTYEALVKRLLGEVEVEEVTGASGTRYQVEIEGFWADGRPGNLLVLVGVDDGGFRAAFSPLNRTFIIARDGSFVGE